MAEIQQLTDSMLAAAAGVLGRLVDEPVAASAASRNDHEGSIRVDGSELVTVAKIPSLGISIVVRFSKNDVSKIVTMMLGGDDTTEMGAMQLSIVSETVSQTAAAMAEELAKGMGASSDGIAAELCNDATNLPPPPFVSYEGQIQVGAELAPEIAMDFDGIAYSKIAGAEEAEPSVVETVAAAVTAVAAVAKETPKAAPVRFTPMNPTPARNSHAAGNLDLVHDVPLQISAVLGKTALPLRDVVMMQSGSVFELDKLSSDPIDLYVNNILIARGEVVVIDDKFAVKISELNPSVE